jgi:membrane dipeptidase
MNRIHRFAILFLPFLLLAQPKPGDAKLRERAKELAQKFIIVDTHIDIPYRLRGKWEDISQRTEKGQFDYVRAKEGGLDAPFMSIYIPVSYEMNGAAALADSLIDMVEDLVKRWPDKFALAKSYTDVMAHSKRGKISLPMGMENGAPLEGKLSNLKHFYDRGIRYITLTHGKDNHIGDSSYDTTHTWKGLSPFGRQVVAEMNRLGIMVDISHVTDDVANQVLEMTKAPVIASHSACRFFTPGFQRNMPDEIIKKLAKNGGVIMIAFARSFLNDEFRQLDGKLNTQLSANHLTEESPEGKEFIKKYWEDNPPPTITAVDVANHIDHVVKLAGVEHVGIGSDFDGVNDSLPSDVKDVTQYSNVIYELLKRGYSEKNIERICGLNLLQVWAKVEQVAKSLQSPNKQPAH